MALRLDDRWLWLGFGIFSYFAVKGIRFAIRDIVELTVLDSTPAHAPEALSSSPEDSISLETLRTLATSPNPDIAFAATSLVISRFAAQPNASALLAKDASLSSDEATRRKAKTAITFLSNWPLSLPTDIALDPSPISSAWTTFDADARDDRLSTPESMPGLIDEQGELVPSSRLPVGWVEIPRERPVMHDQRETERRRWRREAMVLHEGERAGYEEDIIRPRQDVIRRQ